MKEFWDEYIAIDLDTIICIFFKNHIDLSYFFIFRTFGRSRLLFSQSFLRAKKERLKTHFEDGTRKNHIAEE